MIVPVRCSAAVAAFLFSVFSLVCIAQTDTPVVRPEIKAGDRWTYRRMDYDSNTPSFTYEMRVTFVGNGVIHVVNAEPGKEEYDSTYTADWNSVSTKERVFYPHIGWLSFPLQVGKKYKGDFELVRPGMGAFRSKFERNVTVVGWEDIVVPAGKFRALKVVSQGPAQRLDTSFSFTSRNVIWYVPDVKRWVKFTLENTNYRGRVEYWGEELLEYKLQ